MLAVILWSAFGYLCGSIPFAVLIGRTVVRVDPRAVGDGNPGGTNVWKAGGWQIGLVTAVIEILKAFFPVYLAQRAGLTTWALVPVALAPILGHATQPFLNWHGGKALGTTGGSWLALVGPLVFAVYAAGTLPVLAIQAESAYTALAGMLALIVYAVFFSGRPWLTVFALLNTALIFWTHRHELGRPVTWRHWISGLFARREA